VQGQSSLVHRRPRHITPSIFRSKAKQSEPQSQDEKNGSDGGNNHEKFCYRPLMRIKSLTEIEKSDAYDDQENQKNKA
jgi:hypothetical protein